MSQKVKCRTMYLLAHYANQLFGLITGYSSVTPTSAQSSSTYCESTPPACNPAARLIDGNVDTTFDNGACAMTGSFQCVE